MSSTMPPMPADAPVPWQMSRVEGDGGVMINIARLGSGPDPVVCVHGITAQHRSFSAIARAVTVPDGVLAMDCRGRGLSDAPEDPGAYGMATHARDVMRVLDAAGMPSAVLVGHSMGAFVALQAAMDYPERVRGVVLLDGGFPRAESEGGERTELPAEVRAGLARTFGRLERVFADVNALLEYWMPGQGVTVETLPVDTADLHTYDVAPVDGGVRVRTRKVATDADYADLMGTETLVLGVMRERITAPALLLRAQEGFMPGTAPFIDAATVQRMRDCLPLEDVVDIAGSNHYTIALEQQYAAQVGTHITAFHARHGVAGANE